MTCKEEMKSINRGMVIEIQEMLRSRIQKNGGGGEVHICWTEHRRNKMGNLLKP